MSEDIATTDAPVEVDQQEQQQETQTFTQADVDRIVRERIKRERDRFADYDDLKVKASEKATAEERIAALEQQITDANTTALRARVQARFGVSEEDADLFLTASDEETLIKQAQRLSERESERKKQGNVVPREGKNPKVTDDDPRREFLRNLMGNQ